MLDLMQASRIGLGPTLELGRVESASDESLPVVRLEPGNELVACALLDTGDHGVLQLVQDDRVLVWRSDDGETAVIVGRVGRPRAAPRPTPARPVAPNGTTPDVLILEAREQLTLRVGDGSITIRADGKILIKGKDLVSHASRVNRIKGGAVSIN
jgi:hypothetical protein